MKQVKRNFTRQLAFAIAFLLILLLKGVAYSQQCLPQGIHLTTQADIDNFSVNYPGCTVIEGDVCIGGCTLQDTSDITNLNGLSQITSIHGRLHIINNPLLTTLDGLVLTSFHDDVFIESNALLISLAAFQQIERI